MTTYPSAPVDEPTADTLALMHLDPVHRTDRELILDAMSDATDVHGDIDPNRVREALADAVTPQTVGATINGLGRQGVIEPTGRYVVTTGSASGNNGRPIRVWRWAQ